MRMPPGSKHPPRIAEWLLQHLLDDTSREFVIGDLHEEFVRQHGAGTARRRYWVQALRSLVSCRITGRRRAPSRRFDFEAASAPTLRDVLRPALRQFKDHPLYALASTGTLALAVGAACVSFAVVKHAFIDPLPYRADGELVSLLTLADGLATPVSPHVLEDLRASRPPLVEFAPIRPSGAGVSFNGATETISISFVGEDYFTMLGVSPSLGRLWQPYELDAIVISDLFWRDRLARSSAAIGTPLIVDGRQRVIVGIMPPDFVPPYFLTTDIWAPIDMPALLADIRTRRTLTLLARRAPHATAQELDTYLAVFSRQLQQRFPVEHGGQALIARPLRDELVGSARPALIGTAAAAALLLLIVAANIAGLSTAHAVSGRHQLAVRAALGATRGRLFAEQLVDSVVLAVVGSAAGIVIAFGLVKVLTSYQQFFLARLTPVALDATTVMIGLASGLFIGLTAALLPRSVISPVAADALRAARGSSSDVKLTATRTALVVAQVAIALVLLVGAGLVVRTVQHLSARDLGFDSSGLTWVQVNLPSPKYQASDAQLQFEREVLQRVQQIPSVQSSTASVGFPLWGGMMAGLGLKGDPSGTPRREVAYLSVSPNFVRDIGARIVSGRDLLSTDTSATTRVVVINETMARMFWPKGDALGAEVQIGPGSPNERWITVVGIMADMRAHGLTEAIRPTAFGSTLQYSWPRRHIGVRTAGARPLTLATELKAAIQAVDPAVAIGVITSAEQALDSSMARHRLVMLSLTVFGTVALVLCGSGLYAVVVLNSQQRRRDYAIRVALGARRGGVRWMVVRQALALAGAGTLVGFGMAAVGTRALQGLLHGVQPIDGPTFAIAGVALLLLATLAAWQPASRAERVDPAEALRAE